MLTIVTFGFCPNFYF